MARITIPFNAWSKKRLREGKKTCTSRTREYGDIGDTFIVEGKEYKIIMCVDFPTSLIIKAFWKAEGADSQAELRRVLKSIFRGKKLPDVLWLHEFKEVSKNV